MRIEWCWQRERWPDWEFTPTPAMRSKLRKIRETQDALVERRRGHPEIREAYDAQALVEDVWSSSAIEGEHIDSDMLALSLRNEELARVGDRRAPGAMRMADIAFNAPSLSREAKFEMHAHLMAHMKADDATALRPGFSIGAFRETPVFVRSAKRGVVYEAPPPERVSEMADEWLAWVGNPAEGRPFASILQEGIDPACRDPVDAAMGHLWFESIHPFSDGNGRIGRAVADRQLNRRRGARGVLSLAILGRRQAYYDRMNALQKGGGGRDATPWVDWFIEVVERSLELEKDITEAKEREFKAERRPAGEPKRGHPTSTRTQP